ncbi:dienelactone hydrolase, partial [Candidatus Peregrinibacteria bacterium CG11_big_fil_rev_8_21_14_0_20_46_8]
MAFEFKFPDVGEGIHEGEIVRWRVKAGDEVKEDDVLCEMETAKAIVEIPSPKTGTILHLEGNEGDTVKVGALLAVIGEKGEEWENKNTGKQEAAAKAGQAGEEAGNKKQEAAPGVVGSFSNDVSISLPGRAPQPAAQPAVPAAKQPATKTGGIMGAARGQSAQAAPAASPVSSPAPAAPKHPPL